MASVDLVFSAPPLTRGDLVFGDDGSNPATDAIISGTIALARPVLTGVVVLGAVVSGAITLQRPVLAGEVVYVSDTARPLVGHVSTRWQDGSSQGRRIEHGWQDATPMPAATWSAYRVARSLEVGAREGWSDGMRNIAGQHRVRFEDGVQVQRAGIERFQDAVRGLAGEHLVRFEAGISVERGSVERFQDATRWMAGQHRSRYQDARQASTGWFSRVGSGRQVPRGWTGRYQDAWQPQPGISGDPVVPPVDPCYVPSGDLVFEARWSADANLVFICERHGTGPGPGETVVVPVRRIYTVINTATLRRVDGDVLIPTLAMTLTIDVESWTWGFTARTPGSALPDLEPGAGGQPVEVEAQINGVPYRALIEGITRERVFGRSDLSVTGRGKAAVLDAPYTPLSTFGNPSAARTAQQLANDVLTLNGVSIGWAVNWSPEDWLVPAGVFSHQGSYMTALNAIAGAAGAYIQPHRTGKSLDFLLRYPAKPWEWGDVTPDYELPADVVQKEGIVWTDKAAYNRVFVRGVQSGVLGQVTRAGTAGDLEAPMVTDPLITTAVAARQRGLPVLADVGRQAAVSLRLPVLAETGIIPPGKFVRYVDGGVTRIGLVRSTSAAIERAEEKLTIWQTIGVETHVGV